MTSLITTILNERDSLPSWLAAIRHGVLVPDQIVIVDGGSTDGSVEYLRSVQDETLLLYVDATCNIEHHVSPVARGRNIAAKFATGDILVVTDVGTCPGEHWLLRLTRPFANKDVDIVYGLCLPNPVVKGSFQDGAAAVVYNNPVMRSSRNLAIRRSAWDKIGGYPEVWLTAEDTLFNRNVEKASLDVAEAPEAIVYWSPPETARSFMRQMYRYSKGDAICWTHTWMHVKLIAKYAIPLGLSPWYPEIGLPLLGLGFLYGLKGLGFNPLAWLVKLLSDIAHIAGYIVGLFK